MSTTPGARCRRGRAHGTVDLVVEAYDETPIRVAGRWGGKPVTPALVRWRLVTSHGAVVLDWRTPIDHRLVKPEDAAYTTQYALWTRQNKRGRPGRYRFVLAADWDTRALEDGEYLVEVAASDVSRNTGSRRFPSGSRTARTSDDGVVRLGSDWPVTWVRFGAVRSGFTRRRLLGAAAAVGLFGAVPAEALARDTRSPQALALTVRGSKLPFAGDRPMFVTIAPGVTGRDVATVRFALDRRAQVQLDAMLMGIGTGSVAWTRQATLNPGVHEIDWHPARDTPVGTYVMRLTLSKDGRRRVYGGKRPLTPERATAPVVHLLGVEAAFTRRSYLPTEPMDLRVRTDAPSFTLTFLRVGHGPYLSLRSDELTGLQMADPVNVDWRGKRSTARAIRVQSGTWPSGLYTAKLETPDGRVGFAPFILRAPTPGPSRVAVVLPTNTWQAYNLYDADGDGWGDTWYAGGNPPVVLDRPYRSRGVPPRFRRYDYPFLRWLEQTRRDPDFFSDDDLDAVASGDELRKAYDLVVFPGHTEYVAQHAYDVVERYRDLGGRLILLSANNFFWKVDRSPNAIRRIAQWRSARAARVESSSASSTARTTTGRGRGRSSSATSTRRRGCSTARASSTAACSARRSAASGSRSTRRHPTRRRGRRCSRGSPISSARD